MTDDPRYLRILARIADTTLDQSGRLAALETLVEDWLPESHPYRSVPLWSLYDKIKADFEERPYLIDGRAIWKRVSRPPLCISDVL